MKNILKYFNVIFDDFTFNDPKEVKQDNLSVGWTQICPKCRENYFPAVNDSAAQGICGVKNCNNEAEYYLDFENLEELHIENPTEDYIKSYDIPKDIKIIRR